MVLHNTSTLYIAFFAYVLMDQCLSYEQSLTLFLSSLYSLYKMICIVENLKTMQSIEDGKILFFK